jgi:hypothetical protein
MPENQKALNPEHLTFLKNGVQFIQENESDLLNQGSLIPLERLQAICEDDFSWSHFYELSAKQNLILLFAAHGLLPAILESVNLGIDINQAIINLVAKAQKDPDTFGNGIFGQEKEPETLEEIKNFRLNGLYSLTDIIALGHSVMSQVAALRKYGKTLSELVDDVRRGKDDSFWLALHVDPTVINCSVFARRMSIAAIKRDLAFFEILGNKIKIKRKKEKSELDPLRVMLHAFNELKLLDDISQDAAAKLFIDDLQVYSNDGDDPERSLYKFIYRWKKSI